MCDPGVPVSPFPFAGARRTFTGPAAGEGPVAIRYYLRSGGDLVALATFGPLSEGAPGQVHGGAILTVLDEALGAAAWVAGHPVLTVRLATEFRRPVPLATTLLVETRLIRARHRLVQVEGALRAAPTSSEAALPRRRAGSAAGAAGGAGALYASAEGTFMALPPDARARIFGAAP